MKFTKLALTFLSTAILFCACQKSDDVVLKINDKSITRAEFYGDFDKIKNVQLKNAPKNLQKDNSYTVLILKDKFTNDLITRELLKQEFDKRNITASDAEIEAKKELFIKQMGSKEQFETILKENGITDEKLKDDIASEVKVDKLVNSLSKSKATDKDAQKFYNENKAQFTLPERVRVSHILIDTTEPTIRREITDSDKEGKLSKSDIDKKVKEEIQRKEALAQEVRQKALNNPKKFASLAKEYSQDDASKNAGGDIGFVSKGQVVPEFADAAFSQKVGEIGPLVKTQFGQHIIMVTDKASGGVQPFQLIKADIKQYLTEQAKYKALQNLVIGLRANATIEYVDKSLEPQTLKKQIENALPKQKTPAPQNKSLEKTDK